MTSVKLYGIIFVALAGITTVQFGLEFGMSEFGLPYWPVFAAILTLSTIKALSVAGWYMHMFDEPRSITYLALAGLLCVVALTAGAGYSVQ